MTQALYYAPTFARLESQIREAAPDLDVALIHEDGTLSHAGHPVGADEITPAWFWVHGDLMGNRIAVTRYFELMQEYVKQGDGRALWLHTINTGLDVLPYEPLFEMGMDITNNHSQAIAIAEYVMGQVMAHFQHHDTLRRQQAAGVWKYTRFRELGGMRWLIIGFGHIGQEIAVRARTFGVCIDAVRRSSDTAGLAERVFSLQTMPDVLGEADVVVLACTANEETRDLVNGDFIDRMKDESVLVNISRGDVVDENALLLGLERGRPVKAILDVFRHEPLPDGSPLWNHPGVVLTPHCSNAGSGMLKRSETLFLDNLRRRVAGEPQLNVVSEKDFSA